MKCEFCKKTFKRETSFLKHSCTKKKRWMSRSEPEMKLAFQAWLRFYELTTTTKKERTFREFIEKKEFLAFEKLAKFMYELKPVSISGYFDYIFTKSIHVDKWCSADTYEKFIKDYVNKETPDSALERSLKSIDLWSRDNQTTLDKFFSDIGPGTAVHLIRTGRISPWMLYMCGSSHSLLSRMSEEQFDLISEYIDPKKWKLKLRKFDTEVNRIQTILKDYGL